jgi:hypothetical protein
MPSHLAVVDDDGVALRCMLCDCQCSVPESLTVEEAFRPFAALHPAVGHHAGGCPDWSDRH